jgi:hypothetical protein
VGYFLDAEDLKKLVEMIGAGDSDEVIACELKVSRPAVAYRRKQLTEGGLEEFLPPALVRTMAGIKSSVTIKGGRAPTNREILGTMTSGLIPTRRTKSVLAATKTAAQVAIDAAPPTEHERICMCCRNIYLTTSPKHQRLCSECRRMAESEPFGEFVMYG